MNCNTSEFFLVVNLSYATIIIGTQKVLITFSKVSRAFLIALELSRSFYGFLNHLEITDF